MAEAPARTLEFVDVLRQLKRAINKGGKLYNQGDHAGCYKEYLSAAQMICERCVDDEIRKILEKAIKEAEEVGNSTEQAWGLRVAFDLIKDRGRVTLTAAPAAAPAAADKTQAVTDKVGALSVRDDGAGPSGTPEEQAKAEKARKHVMNACKEVLQTETAYVEDLNTIIFIFKGPMESLVDEQALAHIFSNIEDLSRCNTALLEALLPLERAEQDSGVDVVGVIARSFLKLAPFFKLYTAYCKNYEVALKTLTHCRQSSPQLNAFLATQMKADSVRGLTLESFLIKPVQRLTKYPLFFKDLLKEIDPSHTSREALEKAAKIVAEVSQSVDARLSDPSAKMAERLQPLGTEWLNLLAPHRELCLEFYCTIQTGSAQVRFPATGYIFTDLLLLCKRKDKGELKPWLLARLPHCMLGDHALLEDVLVEGKVAGSGLWSEQVEVAEQEGKSMFGLKKKAPAATRRECVLAVRAVGEEGFRLSMSSEAEMEQFLNCMDYALEKLHVHSVEKRRRMIKRSSNISETDSEAIIKRLMSDLHERGVAKKTRSVEVSRVKLEGASQSMAAKQGNSSFASSSIGKAKSAAAGKDTWAPAPPIRPTLQPSQLSKLEPASLMGKWFVAAALPYYLERHAFAAALNLTWDAAGGRVVVETSFADGGYDGAVRTHVREGVIDAETGRAWRLRQKVGRPSEPQGQHFLLPQTPFAVVGLVPAFGDVEGMLLAHGDILSAQGDAEDELGFGLSYLWLLTRATPSVPAPPVVSEMRDLAAAIGFDVADLRTVPHRLGAVRTEI